MPEAKNFLHEYLPVHERLMLRELFASYHYTFISSVFYQNRAPWALEWRVCPDHFFLFPVKGAVEVTLEDGAFLLEPGRCLMLAENVRHRLEIAKGCTELEQISVHYHIHDVTGEPLLARAGSAHGWLSHPVADLEALLRMAHLAEADRETARLFAGSWIRQMLAFQVQAGVEFAPRPVRPMSDPRVATVLQRMAAELADPELSIDGLAEGVGLSGTQLRKLFGREAGVGPKAYLSQLRLRQACGLLTYRHLKICEIAAHCGFASDHYFHLTFRKAYGMTPTEYRHRRMSEV